MERKVNLAQAFEGVREPWTPRVVAALNGQEVKVVRLRGAFCWHHHADADELFYVTKGALRLRLADGDVLLGPGDLFVVPRGVEHLPVAEPEAEVLLFEPAGTRNTGNVVSDLTRP